MVHVCCLEESCRRVLHLDDISHWNFRGTLTCSKCKCVMNAEIKDGQVVTLQKSVKK